MPLPKDKAWFPVKTYGWGWGMPSRWQGWVVMIGFIVALAAGAPVAAKAPLAYGAYVIFLGSLVTAICYWKGEKPGWHWGDSE
jgi:hypothetical protein